MEVQRKIIDVIDTRVVLELPASCVNRRVEVTALTGDEALAPPSVQARRLPSPMVAGSRRTLGGIVGPIVAPSDGALAP